MAIGKLPNGSIDKLERRFSNNPDINSDNDFIDEVILEYLNSIIDDMRNKAFEKGHFANGGLNKSFDSQIIDIDIFSKKCLILYERYGEILNKGYAGIGSTWKRGKTRKKRNEDYYRGKIKSLVKGDGMLNSLARYSQARKFRFKNQREQYGFIWGVMYKLNKYGYNGTHWLDELFGEDNSVLEKSFAQFIEKVYGKYIKAEVIRQWQ